MGGTAADDPAVTEQERLASETRRRFALLRLIFAVPGLFLGLLTVAGAYRMANRPFDAGFWTVLTPVVLGFCGFAGHAVWQLRRNRPR